MKDKTEDYSAEPPGVDPIIKQRRSVSIVWLVPVVALLIGGWLAYKAITEKGPVITITFSTADGLEAGKTKVKYKAVDVGVVESISIGKDITQVVLKVRMNKGAEPYLTDQTKFWVVRAQVSAGEVSGLSTLLGGAYVGVEPSDKGKRQREFTGLETIPRVTSASKGKRFNLISPRLGSLNPGSPIYFRQVKVGQVVDYRLEAKGESVDIDIFVESPYDQFVRENTKFWLASGLDMQLTANGIKIDTDSVVSLMIGGLAFGTFGDELPGLEVQEHTQFRLYEARDAAREDQYTVRKSYYVEFFESTRGLAVGAPVEFRGIQIGTVKDIRLKLTEDSLSFSTMVLIDIERDRLGLSLVPTDDYDSQVKGMIKKGLRAQLKPGNLLTGQLFVDVDFYQDEVELEEKWHNELYVVPSIPSSAQEVLKGVTGFLNRMNKLPIEEIGQSLQGALSGVERLVNDPEIMEAIRSIRNIMKQLEQTSKKLNAQTMPQIADTLDQLDFLIKDLQGWLSADSPLQEELLRSLREIGRAARSINNLADMLERRPEALIQGKASKDY